MPALQTILLDSMFISLRFLHALTDSWLRSSPRPDIGCEGDQHIVVASVLRLLTLRSNQSKTGMCAKGRKSRLIKQSYSRPSPRFQISWLTSQNDINPTDEPKFSHYVFRDVLAFKAETVSRRRRVDLGMDGKDVREADRIVAA